MKKRNTFNKLWSLLLCMTMLVTFVTGCGSSETQEPDDGEAVVEEKTDESSEEKTDVKVEVATSGYQINESLNLDEEVTLSIYGPGLFSSGAEGLEEITTGLFKSGYNELAARWNELYPNCALEIEDIPWDNYQSAIQTAALSGGIDIMVHGHIDGLAENLKPYLDADPEFTEQLFTHTTVKPATTNNDDETPIQGLAMVLGPLVVWVDTEIFEHYGVELPEDDWTYYDLIEIAEQLTGTDPVTGEQTYGVQYYSPSGANLQFNYTQAALACGAKAFELGETIEDAKVNFATKESVEAFEIIQAMAACACPDTIEGVDVSNVIDGNNNWAMMFSTEILNNSVLIEKNGLADRYVVMNTPVCHAGEYEGVPTPWAGETTLAIYKDSEKKDWAWEFIKFILTDDVAVSWLASSNLMIPNNKDGVTAMASVLTEEQMEVCQYALDTLPSTYNNSWNYVRNGRIANINGTAMVTAVDNVVKGVMTPQEAADFLQQSAEESMKSQQ